MQQSSYKISGKTNGKPAGIGDWFHRIFVKEKLNNPVGYLLFGTVALSFSLLVASPNAEMAYIIFAVVVGLPVLFACLFNLQFGIIVSLIAAFFVLGLKKYLPVDLPLGVTLDVVIGVMFFGLFIKQIKERDWSFVSNPISVAVFIWMSYNLLMFANPIAESRQAWFYTVRGMAGLIILFFIAVYAFSSLRYIELVIKVIIGLALLAALYGLYQEVFGLPGFEMKWLQADQKKFKLIYQWGRIRIFSFIGDPSTFGILMAYMGVFCLALMTGPFSAGKKFLLGVSGLLMLSAMVFAGTRTAYVLLPAGFVFFTILTMRKGIIALMVIFMMLGAVVIMIPTSNPTLYRVQSAFRPKDDASMKWRLENQKNIQPYIWTHPIGGGLGSTGAWGARFTPNSMLAKFPPDSGYVRVAVELGWVGLIIFCGLLLTVFIVGIKNYVRCRNPKIRAYYVGLLTVVYAMIIAHYPQDAMVNLPTSIIFYLVLAALVKLKDFDGEFSYYGDKK